MQINRPWSRLPPRGYRPSSCHGIVGSDAEPPARTYARSEGGLDGWLD
ncbi:hypothetical protein ACVI1L_000010 [Bradyrhizobium sp. USDA 4516]